MSLLFDQEVWVRPTLFGPGPRRGLVRVAATGTAGAAGVSTPATAAATATGLVAAGRSAGRPRVVGGSTAAALRLTAAGVSTPAAATLLAAPEAAAATLASATTATTGGLGDLGSGIAQRGADLVDLKLHDGPLLALLGLVRTLPQSSLSDDTHTPRQRLGDVLRGLTPDRRTEEQRVAVLPLVGLAVERSRRRRDREVRDGRAGRSEAQLGIIGQVSDDGDDGLACHGGTSRRFCCGCAATRISSTNELGGSVGLGTEDLGPEDRLVQVHLAVEAP